MLVKNKKISILGFLIYLFLSSSSLQNETISFEPKSLSLEEIKIEFFLSESSHPFTDLIVDNCIDLDPFLVASIIEVESYWDPYAVSSAKAAGLMQTIPGQSTAKTQKELFSPEISIQEGCRYYSEMKERFGNDETALAAYNIGPTKVSKKGIVRNSFSSKVLDLYRKKTKQFDLYLVENYLKTN
jgi:hypothetical protein